MVHSDFFRFSSTTSANASLLCGYLRCRHKYLQSKKLLWKTLTDAQRWSLNAPSLRFSSKHRVIQWTDQERGQTLRIRKKVVKFSLQNQISAHFWQKFWKMSKILKAWLLPSPTPLLNMTDQVNHTACDILHESGSSWCPCLGRENGLNRSSR